MIYNNIKFVTGVMKNTGGGNKIDPKFFVRSNFRAFMSRPGRHVFRCHPVRYAPLHSVLGAQQKNIRLKLYDDKTVVILLEFSPDQNHL